MMNRIFAALGAAVVMVTLFGSIPSASAQNWSWMPGVSFRGAQHTWRFSRDGMQPLTCRQLCQNRAGCRAWTYYPGQYDSAGPPGPGQAGACGSITHG